MRRMVFVILVIILPISLRAQRDTLRARTLKTLTIVENKSKKLPGQHTQVFDSLLLKQYQLQNLNELLQWHSNAFVKNYGVSGMSTMSVRGSSAAQTQVLWNGMNINNAATGMTDLNVLPIGLFDHIQITYQNQEQLGGAVLLNNAPAEYRKNSHLKLALGYQSLRNTHVMIDQLSSNKKWSVQNKVLIQQQRNRFRYYNPYLDSTLYLTHAQQQHLSLLSSIHRKLNPLNEIAVHVWYQLNHRELPPTLFETISKKKEQTKTLRSSLQWNKQFGASPYRLHADVSFIQDQYSYEDSSIILFTKARVQQILSKANAEWKLNAKHSLDLSLLGQQSALLNQHASTLAQFGGRLVYRYSSFKKTVNLQSFVQQEYNTSFDLPLSYGLSAQFNVLKNLELYGNANTNYRTPTLNELFFIPGGNPELKPEVSKNWDGGLRYQVRKASQHLQVDVAAYHRNVDDWIVWYGNTILTPHNIQLVRSRGMEAQVHHEFKFKTMAADPYRRHPSNPITVRSHLLYAYTLSTTEQSAIANDYSIGKQIPYVPRYQLKYGLGLQGQKTGIHYFRTYTGYRFTTTDESEYLKPYSTHNLSMDYRILTLQFQMTFRASLQNILNASYEGVLGRMMPGRNASISVVFEPFSGNCCKSIND